MVHLPSFNFICNIDLILLYKNMVGDKRANSKKKERKMQLFNISKDQIDFIKDILSGKVKTSSIDIPGKNSRKEDKQSVFREIEIPSGVYERMKNILFYEGSYFKTVTLELILTWVELMETQHGGRYPQRGIGRLNHDGKEPKLIHPDNTSIELRDKGYCSSTEVAKMLNCSRHYIGALARDGKIGHLRVGKKLYFTKKQIDEFLAKNTKTA